MEFDKIRKKVCECASTEGAREILENLFPSVIKSDIVKMLDETGEAYTLITTKGSPSFGGMKDIQGLLYRADRGASLNMAELLSVAGVLKTSRSVKEYFENKRNISTPNLDKYSDIISPNGFLENKICESILAEDMMADNASPELADIRRKQRAAANKVRDSLQKFVSGNGEYAKYLQESIITSRNGRYVIPVKSEYRSEIKGLIHDSSSSGATVFIEPIAVVEANNEMAVLNSKEQAEIDRILAALSAEVSRFSDSLRQNYKLLCQLSAIFAKAEYAIRTDSRRPKISDNKEISLVNARHPLLNKDKVVPISACLGKGYTTLVITGPNTGGKTVSLKTLGLFCIMAQSGLMVPCDEQSVLPVLDGVLADIGDEQSIEQSLSTFSAHMVNIVDILSKLESNMLVLFDELGAGTDPIEGAALAESVLEKVKEVGALCAATTHYAELKAYALDTQGVTNASCEFNIETLKPTYRLIVGLPGKSNAFAIATRLGLSKELIEGARQKMSGTSTRFEQLIETLEAQRNEIEAEKKNVLKLRAETEALNRATKEQTEIFNKKLAEQSEKADHEARRLVESAKAAYKRVIEDLEELQRKKEAENFALELEKAKKSQQDRIRSAENKLNPVVEKLQEEYTLPRALKKGDRVLLRDINKEGTVLSCDKENVVVQAGIIKTKTTLSNIKLVQQSEPKKIKTPSAAHTGASLNIKTEIDLRGNTADDAWFMVDKYLDEACLANLNQVTLIHGKGTGALRSALQKLLRRDPRVAEMRMGAYGEGDSGVTVVTLK